MHRCMSFRCASLLLMIYCLALTLVFCYFLISKSTLRIKASDVNNQRVNLPQPFFVGSSMMGNVGKHIPRNAAPTMSLIQGGQSDFQALPNNTGHVYSAYYDDSYQPPVVTVIALINFKLLANLSLTEVICLYEHGDQHIGRVSILPDHHSRPIRPAFIQCPVPNSTLTRSRNFTLSVSTAHYTGRVTNSLRVRQSRKREFHFLVCFSPLHNNFDNVALVMENLELAQILGAEHAVVYITNITVRLDRIIGHYIDSGFVDIKCWRQPPRSVHYKGQMAAINDCLLDNRNRADFIVYMDFDEMIVPRVHGSWSSMIEHFLRNTSLPENNTFPKNTSNKMSEGDGSKLSEGLLKSKCLSNVSPRIGAFSFLNAFYLRDKPTNLTRDELQYANRLHLPFLLKQQRILGEQKARSKTIINPKAVRIMGIHRVFAFHGNYITLWVDRSSGLTQHYRWYKKLPSVKDTSILRFASLLVKRMKNAQNKLANKTYNSAPVCNA